MTPTDCHRREYHGIDVLGCARAEAGYRFSRQRLLPRHSASTLIRMSSDIGAQPRPHRPQ